MKATTGWSATYLSSLVIFFITLKRASRTSEHMFGKDFDENFEGISRLTIKNESNESICAHRVRTGKTKSVPRSCSSQFPLVHSNQFTDSATIYAISH